MSVEVKALDAPAAALAALQQAEQQAAASALDAHAPLPVGPGDESVAAHSESQQTLAVTIDSAPASASASAANTPRPAAAAAALLADADADMAAGLADPQQPQAEQQQQQQQQSEQSADGGAEDKENNENAKPTHHPNQHSIGSTGSADSGKSGSSKGTGVWPAFSHSAAGAANGGVVASTPTGSRSAQKAQSTLHAATFCSLKDDTWSSPSPKPFHSILRTPTPGKLPRGKPGQPGGGLAPGAHGCSGVHKPGSVHENCLCRYKDQNKFTFQPELGHAPLGVNTSLASAASSSTAQLRRGSHVQAMTRALSTPVRANSVVAGVHDSPMRRAVLGDASARANAGIAPGVVNSMGTGVSHITTPDVLSPSLTALTASAASKRKSRSPLPGKRAKLAAEVMLSLDTPIRDLPPTMTRGASAGSSAEPASAPASSADGKSKDAGVQTSPEKDLSALAKQLQLQLLRTAAEHKKLDEQLVAAETKLGAAVGDSALEGECEDLRLKMRAVRDIARDTIALMDRLGVPAGLPQATAFLDQYEEADREDDGDDDADEDDDSGVDADGNPLASPSKSRSKRKKQKLAAMAGVAAAQAAAQKFTFHVEAAAAADGLPLQHHKVDDPEMLNASGALLPPPSSVQLIKSPSNGATSNADFDIDLNGAHATELDALRAKEKELDALRAANALSSAELKAKADKLAAVERELTQTKFAQLKCAVSVAKYHFANGKRAMRWLAVSNDGTRVLWSKAQSMSGAASAALSDVKEVLHGAHTLPLKSNRHSTDAGLLCVSLVLPNRTLDVCFQSQQSLDLWLWGLRQLCKNAKA